MQIFNAVVRLQGSLSNEVRKEGLTVPEIHILRRIHGDDAVVQVQHVGNDPELDGLKEREYLDYNYGQGLSALSDDQKTSVERMFGGDYNPLPETLRDYAGKISKDVVARRYDRDEKMSDDEENEEAKQPKKSTKKLAEAII